MTARRRIAVCAALALTVVVAASGAGGANGAGEFTFYPQAGILWRDLYPNNFVDLDQSAGVRDYACGAQTYDGHTGTDTDVRSFREMDIGVPVFAALDGRVISVQDGELDRNHGPTAARFDNNVVLEHGRGASPSTAICARGSRSGARSASSPGSRSAGRRRAETRRGLTSTSPRRSKARSTSRSPARATTARAATASRCRSRPSRISAISR